MLKKFYAVRNHAVDVDVVLLLIRVVCGYAFILHGWGKIQDPFHWMGPEAPVPAFLQGLAALAEFGGGIAWILGLVTPLSSLGIIITMLVAAAMHRFAMGDPFVNMTGGRSYEPAVMFLLVAILLFVAGPGRYSLDRKLFGTRA
jgi:putative oxidoreductase